MSQSGNNSKNKAANNRPIDYGILPRLMGYQLRRAQLMFFQDFASKLSSKDITPGHLGLLVLISENPGISQTALAGAVGVERSTLGEAVGRLEKRGLLVRERMARDRRSHAVTLSPRGKQTLEEILPLVRQHEADAGANLSADERRQLLTLLGRLANNS